MQTCCVDLWHPKLFEKVAFPQNGHWKPELLIGQGGQARGKKVMMKSTGGVNIGPKLNFGVR